MKATVLLLALSCAFTSAAESPVASSSVATELKPSNVNRPSSISNRADAISIPQMLSYQGKLTDTLGVPVADTTYSVAFRLYTQPSGGSALWSETQNVATRDGLFAVLLGSVTPIGSVPEAGALYLGMSVAGGAELAPRLRIASAAYAFLTARSANADLLQGKDTTALDARYVNEAQANSVTSAMIVNGTIAAADLGQMGASSGQVMKWTGSAWAPRNDSVGSSGSGTVRKVVQAAGVVCSPNPINDSGTVRFDSTYGDGRYIRNQSSTGQNASFRVTGTGQAAQFHGISTSGAVPGIYGDGGTIASGVFGRCSVASSSFCEPVLGVNEHPSGTGVVGAGNDATYWLLTSGSGGAFTGKTIGGYNRAIDSSGTGVVGSGNNVGTAYTYPGGCGGAFAGTNCGAYGRTVNTSGATYGVYGLANNTAGGFGVLGRNDNTGGTGVAGVGNDTTVQELTDGSGGAFIGTRYGVYGHAHNATNPTAGGYFDNGYGSYAYVAYYNGTTNFKIAGGGTVSTIMATREGIKTLFAPEMPEAYFEDCGEGRLVNGHCRVNLEKLFSDCVTVDAAHPLKAFVQLEDDCNGVYVTKDATGFDVHELQGGMSAARFSWRVLAKWKGNENVRLPEAPGPLPTVVAKRVRSVQGTTIAAPSPQSVSGTTVEVTGSPEPTAK